jgi:hypothetical protein
MRGVNGSPLLPEARPARVPHLLKDCASIGLPSVTRTATRQKPLVRASPSRAEATRKRVFCFPSTPRVAREPGTRRNQHTKP